MKKISVILLAVFTAIALSGCSEARDNELLVEIEPSSFALDELDEIVMEITFTNIGDRTIEMEDSTPDIYFYDSGKWVKLPGIPRFLAGGFNYMKVEPGETVIHHLIWATFKMNRYRHEFTAGTYRLVFMGTYNGDEEREWYGEFTIKEAGSS